LRRLRCQERLDQFACSRSDSSDSLISRMPPSWNENSGR
jgi:hypothetical protein